MKWQTPQRHALTLQWQTSSPAPDPRFFYAHPQPNAAPAYQPTRMIQYPLTCRPPQLHLIQTRLFLHC